MRMLFLKRSFQNDTIGKQWNGKLTQSTMYIVHILEWKNFIWNAFELTTIMQKQWKLEKCNVCLTIEVLFLKALKCSVLLMFSCFTNIPNNIHNNFMKLSFQQSLQRLKAKLFPYLVIHPVWRNSSRDCRRSSGCLENENKIFTSVL